jgi:molybdate-binding protein
MQPLGTVNRQDQIVALADEHRLSLLRRLMCGPSTISRLGRDFERHPAWVRHHIKRLAAVGLVEPAGERTTRNYTEKFYRATSGALAIHMLVAPDPGSQRVMVALGSDDFALQLLADEFNDLPGDYEIVTSSVGSLDGLIALREGLADVAGCHLFDAAADDFNVPYLRHLFPDRDVVAVTLAHREQGLMHAHRDRRVLGLEDLVDPAIRFVNRNPGSGTRVWLDTHLRELGIAHGEIQGYEDELRTHGEVALAIVSGAADVGLGVREAAEEAGLEFTSLFTERYDLVFDAERTEAEGVRRLRDRLGSRALRDGIDRLRGYDSGHTGEETRLAV